MRLSRKNAQNTPKVEVSLKMRIGYVRCFSPGANYRGHDHVLVPAGDARAMVADGLAEFVNHGKDIRMFARTITRLRDRSCSWSHRMVELVGEGNQPACKMLEEIGRNNSTNVA